MDAARVHLCISQGAKLRVSSINIPHPGFGTSLCEFLFTPGLSQVCSTYDTKVQACHY